MLSDDSSSIEWVFARLNNRRSWWNLASTLTVSTVGLFSKIVIKWLNFVERHNEELFFGILQNRLPNVPLITVSNHFSCYDDPGLWGCLNLSVLCSSQKMRWSLAAHDICFTNKLHSYFFMLGKCLPVIRGKGVNQEAMNFCLEQLEKGQWVHVFPEGQVNLSKEFIRFKWGVGKLIYDCSITPLVIPIWHIGFDKVWPNEPPYMFKVGKKLTVNYGIPIDLNDFLRDVKMAKISCALGQKLLTDIIQCELLQLQNDTAALHNQKAF